MPFEIFVIPGLLFALFGFYRGLKLRVRLEETSKEEL